MPTPRPAARRRSLLASFAVAGVALSAAAVLVPGFLGRAEAADVSVEAEAMSWPTATGGLFSDASASGGRALVLHSNTTAAASLTSTAPGQLVVRTRGDQCQGAPTMTVLVNGVVASKVAVSATTWSDHVVPGLLRAATNRITVRYAGDFRSSSCNRNLRLDRLTVRSAAVEQQAETMALTPGAGQPFTDVTADAGRGLLVWSNGTASGTLSASAGGSLVLRARGEQCAGAPLVSVALDGQQVGTVAVAQTSWAEQTLPVTWPGGAHRVDLAFVNDYAGGGCDRNLRLDSLAVRAAAPVPTPTTGNPFSGAKGYIDPQSDPRRAADARRSWDPVGAAALDKVASGPYAVWYGDWIPTANLAAQVNARVTTETGAGALPVLVAYAIPHRDCGGYSAGGSADADAYRAWMRQFAAGIGTRKVAVVLEPDALAQLDDCLADAAKAERMALMSEAVSILTANPATSVYLDAGNPGWITPSVMASRLTTAGVAKTRGFALNVSNFATDAANRAYGKDISDRIGGKPFVVDTSRNGLGPGDTWCNPSGRALGQRFNANTGDPYVDAYTWLKGPGGSDGTCNGGPSAGTFWPEYAIGLGQRAAF